MNIRKFLKLIESGEIMNHQNIVLVVSVTIYKNSKVFIIQETKPKAFKKWNFPSGRIEIGEDILKAARREVKEETGYDVKLSALRVYITLKVKLIITSFSFILLLKSLEVLLYLEKMKYQIVNGYV